MKPKFYLIPATIVCLTLANPLFSQDSNTITSVETIESPADSVEENKKSNLLTTTYNGLGLRLLFLNHGILNNNSTLKWTNGIAIEYTRSFGNFFNIAIPLRYGVINVEDDINNRKIAGIDLLGQVQYELENLKIIPYAFVGGGLVYEEKLNLNYQIPAGLGLKYKIAENGFINIQAEYRNSFEDNRNNLQGGVGFSFRFKAGVKDSDNDGIPDEMDNCPSEVGSIENGGCPDSDGDGIPDDKDLCPNDIGSTYSNGCPDKDEDGVPDAEDGCPEVTGSKKLNGCPDSDGDGVGDDKDFCPQEAGPISNMGCPIADSDGDGIPDERDYCPNDPGQKSANGCPDRDGDGVADDEDECPDLKGYFNGCPDSDGDGLHDGEDPEPQIASFSNRLLSKEAKMVLEYAKEEIRFDYNKSNIKEDSKWVLDRVVDIMNKYPDYLLRIGGHTDNIGGEAYNQILSEQRVKSCYNYIVAKGIAQDRIVYFGFGESRPITGNKTAIERQLNRRVELELFIE